MQDDNEAVMRRMVIVQRLRDMRDGICFLLFCLAVAVVGAYMNDNIMVVCGLAPVLLFLFVSAAQWCCAWGYVCVHGLPEDEVEYLPV